ncbi:diguanylate cyclase [Roseateles toxinivorans]|uniref:diguanylate cyclase n=1 Tax=Roseateles toxinivorans TaxID=270368 RepID=A0A4V3CT81_9BURK|nr:diguanylate cyclase [Roseateles toxinivorans]TDP64174.1 diguanylate cyclase (GGDEF)-like protein [Roseateles toxinivorans]
MDLVNGSVESLSRLLDGIDAAVQDHLSWNQGLFRSVLLGEAPAEGLLRPGAHERCHLGLWLQREHAQLSAIDAELTQAVAESHGRMHDGARELGSARLEGRSDLRAALTAYEEGQRQMISSLAELKHAIESVTGSIDVLTGLPLRHGLDAVFVQCRRDARREGRRCYLAMIDVDHFKSVNDRFGHPAGDEVLVHVARTLRVALRENDPLIRYGGEEFLALLRCDDVAAAELAASRLLEALRGASIELGLGRGLRLTATIGLAEALNEDSLQTTLMRADRALLQGKLNGRDRHVMALAREATST